MVETLCALLDQLVPSSRVVSLSAQSVHLHLLNQLVRPKNVVALAWVMNIYDCLNTPFSGKL